MRVLPVAESDRFEALDVLRGCAVLGILLMNIRMFAMPLAAYFNPLALGQPIPRDYAIWSITQLLIDQKFMTIFSLLFGAGVLLLTDRIAQRGARPAAIHYKRMLWLLVFGLIHAYLLWHGDILVLYALCGLWIYPARNLAARRLLVVGLTILAIGSLLSLMSGLSMRFWPPEQVRLISDDFWSPPPAQIAEEIAAFRGGWFAQLPWRASYALEFHTFELFFWGIWRATGLMLLGMALLKWKVLTGERPPEFYARLAVAGFSVGLPMVAFGLWRNHTTGWNVRDAYFLNSQWNYWGSVPMSLGWIGLFLRWWQSGVARRLVARLANVGRMAFSCYIAETIICTTMFYGHGFGLFGTTDQLSQLLVTFAVWLALLAAGPLWLARYRYGPLEWLWRSLTYGRVEPLRRRAIVQYVSTVVLVVVLAACGRDVPPATQSPQDEFITTVDVVELSATDARDRMAAGTLTSRALTQAYLDRIRQIDDAGPMLNAIIEVSPTAIADGDALDAERKAGKVRGPLHGIPLLIKDNIDVVGMVNSAGSLALAENRPKQDAVIVRQLRDAGAVILGKTNLSEWANFRSSRSTSGWSSRGGQTKNPYVLDRNPCGSSSGTGVAIAASLASIGIGTETDGSIICPASVNGLVGMKPTVGIVSRDGIIPIAASQDTAGPMARSVADAAMLLNALVSTTTSPPQPGKSRYEVLGNDGLRGKRLGVLRQATGFHPDVDSAFEKAVVALKAEGAEIVDVKIGTYNDWRGAEIDVLLYEFKDGLNQYLKASGSRYASLADIIAFNSANADRVMPFFGQELFERAQAKGALTDPAYAKAREAARRLAGKEGLVAALDRETLDAIIAPSMSPAWPTDHVLGDHFVGAGYSIAAVAGTPSITVPIGESHGLPLGLTIMGRAYSEAQMIALAYSIEQTTKARRPPQFKQTAP